MSTFMDTRWQLIMTYLRSLAPIKLGKDTKEVSTPNWGRASQSCVIIDDELAVIKRALVMTCLLLDI